MSSNTSISRKAIRDEIMSMLPCKYQTAKDIHLLSEVSNEKFKKIKDTHGSKRPMSNIEAKRIVDMAIERIRIVDEGD
jgi:hypothetical protein